MLSSAVVSDARPLILNELTTCVEAVSAEELSSAQQALLQAQRIFVAGAGRSGLAIRMAAMRLMHFGLQVHVVGEVTTPAIAAGDLLLIASGSGTTAGAVQAARVAKNAGARILAFTIAPASPLGELADHCVVIPAALKQEHSKQASQQYAGSLFEQSVLLLSDALFQQMWWQGGDSAPELWKRHANLE